LNLSFKGYQIVFTEIVLRGACCARILLHGQAVDALWLWIIPALRKYFSN